MSIVHISGLCTPCHSHLIAAVPGCGLVYACLLCCMCVFVLMGHNLVRALFGQFGMAVGSWGGVV